jgi:hypothetical protein
LKPLDKIFELRKYWRLSHSRPMAVYHNRIRRPKQIISLVEQQSPPSPILQEARRQYVVTLACAFEVFWRQLVRDCVDAKGLDKTKLKGLENVKMSLTEVATVFHDDITFGELVSCSLPLQSVAQVNKSISTLVGVDAFAEFRNFKVRYTEVVRNPKKKARFWIETIGPIALKKCSEIDICFDIRHDYVHSLGYRHRLSSRKLFMIEHSIWFFNVFFGMYVESKFEKLSKGES